MNTGDKSRAERKKYNDGHPWRFLTRDLGRGVHPNVRLSKLLHDKAVAVGFKYGDKTVSQVYRRALRTLVEIGTNENYYVAVEKLSELKKQSDKENEELRKQLEELKKKLG